MAAFNIRGQTIHSELDIHPSSTGDLVYQGISTLRFEELKTRFRACKLLIIDEVWLIE